MQRLIILIVLLMLCLLPAQANDDATLLTTYGRGRISDMALHPSGDMTAVASPTGIWLYDTTFNTVARVGDGGYQSVRWNDDGLRFAAYSPDNGCEIWQIVSGELVLLTTHEQCGQWQDNSLSYRIETGVAIFDTDSGDISTIQTGGNHNYHQWHPDGTQILTLSDTWIALWDAMTGERLHSLDAPTTTEDGHPFRFAQAAFWHDDSWLILGRHVQYGDEIIYTSYQWDTGSNQLLPQTVVSTGATYSIQPYAHQFVAPDSVIALYTDYSTNSTVLDWSGRVDGERYNSRDLQEYNIADYQFTDDMRYLVVATADGHLIRWDVVNQQIVTEVCPHGFRIATLDWHPDGSRVLMTGRGAIDPLLLAYEDQQLTPIETDFDIIATHEGRWSADGDSLIFSHTFVDPVGHSQPFARYQIYDAETYTQLDRFDAPPATGSTSQGEMIGYADDLSRNLSYNPETGFDANTLQGFPAPDVDTIADIQWSPDKQRVFVIYFSNSEQHIVVWETVDDDLTMDVIYEQPVPWSQVRWTPDSQYLTYIEYTDAVDNTVQFIPLGEAPERPSWTVTDAEQDIYLAAWHPDGVQVAITSGNIHIMNTATGDLTATIPATNSLVRRAVDWHPDGNHIAIGYGTGIIEIWQIQP